MADLVINERDAERLREIARRENRPIEQIVTRMIDTYTSRPSDGEASYLSKRYAYARKYWQSVNDSARLSLTDEQLDEQFWCIDPEGIPRLKSDQDKIMLPEDGLLTFLENVWADNPTGEVEEPINYRELLNKDFPDYLMRRMSGNDDPTSTD